ncbi:Gfo/Idh/MocA family oxidoreductase [Cnuibacter physcomitrellae]|uniref:Gfo/Idh/MocA family protein n=1 Tax=Cnuibacter physcomitrellae TaxID=1619308 RepID=UPI0021758A21|nr:Gfo/Idh/MocA family oxidoreductase [Cnuibacter physcomitrellae]MCS5498361.1 Gfo/Idh/MocA family oxidoreductase [Cnuibacter physcomitrellae]
MSAISAGFVGAGFMGDVHTRAARANGARLAGLVGSTPERGEAAARRLGVERAYPDLEAMLADPSIDVVHVLSPNALHAEQALAVIESGKNVVCEKPLAIGSAAAAALVEAAEGAGMVNAVPFAYRFHPMVREARSRTHGQRILTVDARYLQDWLADGSDDWRVDPAAGGRSRAFADIGSHLVDMIEFVTGERIIRLVARSSTAFPERGGREVLTEDAVALLLELEGGGIGTALVSQVATGRKNQLAFEVATDGASFAFDQEHPDDLWVGLAEGGLALARDAARLSPDAARLSIVPVGHPLGYLDAFTAFVGDVYAAIAGEVRDGLPTFRDGLRAARLTDAVLASIDRDGWTDTSPEPID